MGAVVVAHTLVVDIDVLLVPADLLVNRRSPAARWVVAAGSTGVGHGAAVEATGAEGVAVARALGVRKAERPDVAGGETVGSAVEIGDDHPPLEREPDRVPRRRQHQQKSDQVGHQPRREQKRPRRDQQPAVEQLVGRGRPGSGLPLKPH